MKLTADGQVELFELTPLTGGTIYMKAGVAVDWQGQTYESVPCQISGEEQTADKQPTPKFVIGQDGISVVALKGLVFDGHLEGATLVKKTVLLEDLLANRNVKATRTYRVKRAAEYGATSITLVLASFSGALHQTLPHRQYIPPAFPWVSI